MIEEASKPAQAGLAKTVVVSGASGAIGRVLVEALVAHGHVPILLGREPEKLEALWPGILVAPLERPEEAVVEADWLVHLAARNNDAAGSLEDFQSANVASTFRLFDAAGLRFRRGKLFVSSTRAIMPAPGDFYGLSKQEAERVIADRSRDDEYVLRLPAVHAGTIAGRLAFLSKLPRFLRPTALVSALRQQVHRDTVVSTIMALIEGRSAYAWNEPVELADSKDDDAAYRFLKRTMDVVCALVILIGFSWLLVLVWFGVKTSSAGPGVFAQERVGRDGRSFICYKFRTMKLGSKVAASHEVGQSSITHLGRILRKTKLDELPQAVNLLRGEMSLVGPRPCLPIQVELIEERKRRGVLAILPGITGWAQINDVDMSDPVKLARMDAEYVLRRSLILDLRILLATVTGSGLSDRTAA